jgi:hypothetical protein
MDKVRKPNISVCYTPSSEPYSIYLNLLLHRCNSDNAYPRREIPKRRVFNQKTRRWEMRSIYASLTANIHHKYLDLILSRVLVTTDGIWIGE